MNRDEIKQNIRKILVQVLKHEAFEMKDELTAKDVDGWDSLTHMEIITSIEKHFGVTFKLKELNKLKNMATLVELVETKLAGG